MPRRATRLSKAIQLLRKQYGSPAPLPTADLFELVLWENVAYLASPSRRREAFEQLKRTVGMTPDAITTATPEALQRVTGLGILQSSTASKLRRCAEIAIEHFDGHLSSLMNENVDKAKRALRRFPGIGEPGAEKILLFAGRLPQLAPESNGLRVLVRLGLVREAKSYSQTYRASREVAKHLPAKPSVMQEAHLLLQEHGQTICKRIAPQCAVCPLANTCAYAFMLNPAPGGKRRGR